VTVDTAVEGSSDGDNQAVSVGGRSRDRVKTEDVSH
jgi:hypothetical protein